MARRSHRWIALTVALLALAPAAASARDARHAPRAPRPPEEQALLDIRQDGERRVEALLEATRGWSDPVLLRARDRRIGEMRRDAQLRELHARAAYARKHGERVAAREFEREIDQVRRSPRDAGPDAVLANAEEPRPRAAHAHATEAPRP